MKKYVTAEVINAVRAEAIEECAVAIPSNWLDPLLTGADAPQFPISEKGVEHLLRQVAARIRSLTKDAAP